MTPEEPPRRARHELPPRTRRSANYVGAVTVGQIVFVSGHGPYRGRRVRLRASWVATSTSPRADRPRELTIVNLLASLKAEIGELDRVAGS